VCGALLGDDFGKPDEAVLTKSLRRRSRSRFR
jgi:hypothetical protein